MLEKWLERVDKLTPDKSPQGLAQDIRSYLFTGEPLAVLNTVAQHEAIAKSLHLEGYFSHLPDGADKLPDFYEHFEALPPATGLRWARLMEASLSKRQWTPRFQFPAGRHWPEVLLIHNTGQSVNTWSNRWQAGALTALALEALLAEDGQPAWAVVLSAFATPVSSGYGVEYRLKMARQIRGFADALDRHLEHIRPLLLPAAVDQRLHMLAMLETAQVSTLDRLAAELAELSTVSSKQVRAAAEVLLRKCGDVVAEPLKSLGTKAKPEQRQHALRLLMALGKERKQDAWSTFARETAGADKAPSVSGLLIEWDGSDETAVAAAEAVAYDYTVPVIDWSPQANAVPDASLKRLFDEIDQAIVRENEEQRQRNEQAKAQGHNWGLRQITRLTDRDARDLRQYLASPEAKPPKRPQDMQVSNHAWPAIERLALDDGLTPVATLKLLLFFGLDANHHQGSLAHQMAHAINAMHQKTGRPSLLEFALMLDESGLSGKAILISYCNSWGQPFASGWATDAVWPYFAHHVDLLVQTLTANTSQNYWFDRSGLFRAIALLPSPPPALVNALFSLALGTAKTDRIAAQDALQNLPGKEARIIAALADGKSETRAVAATWLARLRHEGAIPALEQAVAKEKHDVAKGAMLDALQALGRPVEKYLDRKALAAEATKTLAKGVPADLAWFPWSALPPVRWNDTPDSVPVDVLRMFIVQAFKQKTPEPNAVLRKFCGMFEPRDREAFGQFVLETWLREDVRPISADEAMKQAVSQAQSTHRWMAQSPQYYQNDPKLGKSVEELTAMFLPALMRQPAGSAIASKGVLAVAAACAAERAAPPVQRYLKEWYGTRAAHGKALIAMLAWIEHPSATQLMLSIGSRFRTKSFQEEATRQAEALADRRGWTLAELADRTVPSGGFDETGTLELSFGGRTFTARLLPDFKVELYNPEGKKIAALPEPRQDDDAELAKEAKKAFSAAKKEIKSIVDLQTERLYEALCTERDWPFADWRDYLQQHPVLRHLVQRLVWVEHADGRTLRSFRPLDDGTLTDRDDNEVQLGDDARVRVAHDSVLGADEVQAWLQHLADYEIKPLFQQLGKGVYTLPEDKQQADAIKDFEGHLLEAFALRGRALKLGYTRGPAEDGGWFHVYQKRFPTLGLEAVLEFTGNPLPEENRTVALMNMSFGKTGAEDRWQRANLPLKQIPKVLLSECYNDLRLIAADGPGFDAEWRKKSEY
ncbi:DUF4132 domain-containing protein [Piscinibacter terrae]|uniref:DUF4132 domain-containing protein n=1 Tax=Piscinibacter terrae TaxID=2496871 RepID=UPI0013869C3B|nr:DUF4132 domain-containing protein [Albitalea terrae]